MSEAITAPRVAPPAASAALTEHVNVLMDIEMRAFLLGSRIADDARGEAVVARALLADAINYFRETHPEEYARRRDLGADELLRRRAARPA